MSMSKEDRTELAAKLAEAAYHMAACWDALREIEGITGTEVETQKIKGLAGDCDCPANYPTVDDEYVTQFLEGLED